MREEETRDWVTPLREDSVNAWKHSEDEWIRHEAPLFGLQWNPFVHYFFSLFPSHQKSLMHGNRREGWLGESKIINISHFLLLLFSFFLLQLLLHPLSPS